MQKIEWKGYLKFSKNESPFKKEKNSFAYQKLVLKSQSNLSPFSRISGGGEAFLLPIR